MQWVKRVDDSVWLFWSLQARGKDVSSHGDGENSRRNPHPHCLEFGRWSSFKGEEVSWQHPKQKLPSMRFARSILFLTHLNTLEASV